MWVHRLLLSSIIRFYYYREQLEMFRLYAVIAILDTLLLMASFAIQCDMNLPDVMKDKSNPIGRYLIEVSGHPRSYTPNQKYTGKYDNLFIQFIPYMYVCNMCVRIQQNSGILIDDGHYLCL